MGGFFLRQSGSGVQALLPRLCAGIEDALTSSLSRVTFTVFPQCGKDHAISKTSLTLDLPFLSLGRGFWQDSEEHRQLAQCS